MSPPDAAAPEVTDEGVEDEVDSEDEEVKVDEKFDVAMVLLCMDELPLCDIAADEVDVYCCWL